MIERQSYSRPDMFYDTDELSELAINLFHGWGYNFYRAENQLRADDQLIRAKAVWLLNQATASVEAAESAYRREKLQPPSRAHPFPDAVAVAGAQTLERLRAGLCALAGTLQSAPVPENDRMTQRYRHEAETLAALITQDQVLIGQCELLRAMLDGQDGAWMLEHAAQIETGIKAARGTFSQRESMLLSTGL
jgi:hypothetical protein